MVPIRNASGERLDVSFHEAEKSDFLVILGHGLTGNKDRPLLVALAEALAEKGWPCLRISFSGNGESEGERIQVLVSLAGMVNTAEFAEREFGDVLPGEGYMWDKPDCPLSQSYVTDLKQIGNTLGAARELRLPWLLLHGSADDVVFPADSQDLMQVLRGPSELVEIEGAGHSFENHYSSVIAEVTDWLEKYL